MELLRSIINREAALALVLGLVTTKLINTNKRQAITSSSSIYATPPSKLIAATDTFTTEELFDIQNVFEDDEPEGKFLRARHGVTHYKVDRSSSDSDNDSDNDSSKSKKGMVVLSHGLGASMKMYDKLSAKLVQNGFSVLKFDNFGHGYSKYEGKDGKWVKYTSDMFVDQLEDLLDHVYEEEKEEVVGFIGHSNGGAVGICANFRWGSDDSNRKVIPKVALVNPAIYAKKPFIANVADSIPGTMTTLMKVIPFARSLVGNSYIEALDVAFGKDPSTGKYNFPDAYKKCIEANERLFGKVKGVNEHPFISQAVLGTSSYNIPAKKLPTYVNHLSEMVQRNTNDILLVWGDLDVTVPYKENVKVIREMGEGNDNFTLEVLDGLSHECFYEDDNAVASKVLPFLDSK